MSDIYPLAIEPRLDERIWGGHRLVEKLGKPGPRDRLIGESWEIYDENRVLNGPYAGKTIGALRRLMGRDLTGHVSPEAVFPLLTKLIDARDVLSVQVHPDDRFARSLEHQSHGKTECWYILAADPGSTLTYGFARNITPDEYERLVQAGELESVLREVPVHPGDVVYIPAGTVHAIGAGILLFELQQTSDVTYRIYDWNRKDAEGRPRELHVEKARQVLDYHRFQRGLVKPLHAPDGKRSMLVAGPYFTLELAETGRHEMETRDSPIGICALGGSATVTAREESVTVDPYSSLLVPAAAGSYVLDASGTALVASVPVSQQAVRDRLREWGVPDDEIDPFLQQFAPAGPLGVGV